ncbi:MAG: FxsA family protein [Alteromonadaceae bacterium]|nr:FxsA family protein [Alteromonadaceae bacterium]
MFRILFIFFIVIPIIEIAVIMQVGALIGAWPTVAIVVLTAWFGAKKVREQGLATLTSVQTKMAQGQMPSDEIIAGVMLLISGVLLVTPGFVTDAFGLALLFPQVRAIIAKSLKQHLVVKQSASANIFEQQYQQPDEVNAHIHHGEIIEGEYERKEE